MCSYLMLSSLLPLQVRFDADEALDELYRLGLLRAPQATEPTHSNGAKAAGNRGVLGPWSRAPSPAFNAGGIFGLKGEADVGQARGVGSRQPGVQGAASMAVAGTVDKPVGNASSGLRGGSEGASTGPPAHYSVVAAPAAKGLLEEHWAGLLQQRVARILQLPN